MAFFGEQSGWGGPARQASWEQQQQQPQQQQQQQQQQSQQQQQQQSHHHAQQHQQGQQQAQQQQAPPSRSGANSATTREDAIAFHSQIDEVDRAVDNLVKSGKFPFMAQARRDSMPQGAARPFVDFDPRMGPRHHSVTDFEGSRQVGGGVSGFYQNQRYGPRGEADQMMQAKRRMAAQRERELRNYHQEQQYNRNLSGAKSDRSMSPNTMSEEDRRELIARQHRALYGDNSSLYAGDAVGSRPVSQDARVAPPLGGRGNSPLAFDQFGVQSPISGDGSSVQMPSRDPAGGKEQTGAERDNSTASPASNPNATFNNLFENAQHSSRTSNSSPTGGSPPRQGQKATAGVAPIGTRPNAATGPAQALNKRSTTPLPSPLSYGFSASEQQGSTATDRATSAASNNSGTVQDKGVGLGWGSNSGVWGNSAGKLGVQASVWG